MTGGARRRVGVRRRHAARPRRRPRGAAGVGTEELAAGGRGARRRRRRACWRRWTPAARAARWRRARRARGTGCGRCVARGRRGRRSASWSAARTLLGRARRCAPDLVRRFVLCAVRERRLPGPRARPAERPGGARRRSRPRREEGGAVFVPTLIVGPGAGTSSDPRWREEAARARRAARARGASASSDDGRPPAAGARWRALVGRSAEATGLPVEVQVQAPGGARRAVGRRRGGGGRRGRAGLGRAGGAGGRRGRRPRRCAPRWSAARAS